MKDYKFQVGQTVKVTLTGEKVQIISYAYESAPYKSYECSTKEDGYKYFKEPELEEITKKVD